MVKLHRDTTRQVFNSGPFNLRTVMFGVITCIASCAAGVFICAKLRNADIDGGEWTFGSIALVFTGLLSLFYQWNWGVIMARPEMYAGLYAFVRVPLRYTGLMWMLVLIPTAGALYFTFTLPLVISILGGASLTPPLLPYICASWTFAAIEAGTIVALLLLLYFSYSSEETKKYLQRNKGPRGLGYLFYLVAKYYVSRVDEQLAANEGPISIGD